MIMEVMNVNYSSSAGTFASGVFAGPLAGPGSLAALPHFPTVAINQEGKKSF